MKTIKGLSRRGFDERFGDNEKCVAFLANRKWGNGFFCIKCNDTEWRKGKKAPSNDV